MYKQNLRYKKIKDFVETLNEREMNYLYRKLKTNIIEKEVEQLSLNFLETVEHL